MEGRPSVQSVTVAAAQTLVPTGIGGSGAAAAVGLSPWSPPIVLYQRLVGELERDQGETDAMLWGKLLEDVIRRRYAEVIGVTVQVPPRSIFHDEHDWRRATPDGLVVHPGSGRWQWGLEVKTADPFHASEWGDPGTDQIPMAYVCQVAWYMHVTGLARWDVAVLIGGKDFRIYSLERDLDLESELVGAVDAFWNDHVIARVPPAIDGSAAFTDYLCRRWPSHSGTYLPACAEHDELVMRICQRRAAMSDLKAADEQDCNTLRAVIAEAAGLETAHGRVHWKHAKARSSVNWEKVARALAVRAQLTDEAINDLCKEHTAPWKASRPLRLPRLAGQPEEE